MRFLDPVQVAQMLIEQHGAQAHACALEQAGERQFRNDDPGYHAWMRILRAIEAVSERTR